MVILKYYWRNNINGNYEEYQWQYYWKADEGIIQWWRYIEYYIDDIEMIWLAWKYSCLKANEDDKIY